MPVTLFTLYLIACMVGSNTTGQQCKPSEVSIPGKALNGHTFKATVVSRPIQCQMLCENDPKCRSYNFHILTKNCELNDETKETSPNDFATDDLRFYMKREDIDECSTGKHSCSHVAVCNNTSGSYNCACKEGYVGDGRNCSDIDECLTEEHNCSHVAVCNNTIGSYNCTCQEGYVGDGRSCSDIPECKEVPSPCAVKADCHNTEGSYICTCKAGYTGDGKTCKVIIIHSASGKMIFTLPYKGQVISGTVGSSVNFTWTFSGGVEKITWGLKNQDYPGDIKPKLVVLYTSDSSVSVQAPPSYSQRVSGVFVGDASSGTGQAIFTIFDIKKEDQVFYSCQLTKIQNYVDNVQLTVD
ncbi:uncharacterized protein [Montipora capricornis]|uniref:uncharacterized protein n=1 Tax=Montipora capricornis TaxID=246305 RepID=UPI0035F1DBE1